MLRLVFATALLANLAASNLIFSPQDVAVEVGGIGKFEVTLNDEGKREIVKLYPQQNVVVELFVKALNISKDETKIVKFKGLKPGHVVIAGNISTRPEVNTEEAVVRITVGLSYIWIIMSDVVGWMYFAAWSISFYPQIYDNYMRKSVVGLNFDFLTLNFLGFFLYSVFNLGMYGVESIKISFHERHPNSVNPVQMNDIVFSVHAFVAVTITLFQCYIYERENQKVSKFAVVLFVIYAILLGSTLVLASTSVLELIDFLYICSYVKLSITLIKYLPQAYMNYKRKSTLGWSIGNIFLDFTGGTLSMLQMIINCFNYDDWESIFGDATKFGLGLFSVLFDVFFLVQHYILYRGAPEP